MKDGRRNWVGHCYSRLKNNDKLYIVTIQDVISSGASYKIVCYWGRAGSKLREKIDGFYGLYDKAVQGAYGIFVGKLTKGYIDLSMNDSSYTGALTMDHPYVQPYLVEEEINMLDDDEQLVRCVNNSFIESDFDADVEYVVRGVIPEAENNKIEVENRFGNFVMVDKNRFEFIQ